MLAAKIFCVTLDKVSSGWTSTYVRLCGESHSLAKAIRKCRYPFVPIRWQNRDTTEKNRARTERSFCVPKAEIVAQGYDLSLNRYKEIVHDEVEHRPPLEIIADIEKLEGEIAAGLTELKAMLS